MDTTREVNVEQAAGALCARIVRYFRDHVAKDEAIDLKVDQGDQQPTPSHGSSCTMHFILPDGSLLHGQIDVHHVGGNMFDVEARLEDHCRSFTESLPEGMLEGDVDVGTDICEYLFDEVKRIVGEQVLRQTSAPKSSSANSKD